MVGPTTFSRPSPQLQHTQAVHLWLSVVAEVGLLIEEELPLAVISGLHQDHNLGEGLSGVGLLVLEGNGE